MSGQIPSFSVTPHRVFEVTLEGAVTFHGYSVDEVVMLLESYRTHAQKCAEMMTGIQSVHDAAHWNPVGPEDVT